MANGRYLWAWQYKKFLRDGGKVIPFGAERVAMNMSLQPVTENPKVRNLTYNVEVMAYGTGDLVEKFGNNGQKKNLAELQLELKSLLYEFNERQSGALSEFYNPLSPEQQSRFYQLFERELGPDLSKHGFKLHSASFSLP